METIYMWADMVVCRAGATTIAELAVVGKPICFIPFPYATHNHQVANGKALVQCGGALLIEEKNLIAADFANEIITLLQDVPRLEEMARATKTLAQPQAAMAVMEQVVKLV